jgi:hypothetical protein
MRFLLAILAIGSLALAATNRAAELETLKRQFPAHVASPVTDKSDPAVQKCFKKYRDRVQKLSMENLAQELYGIQEDAESEFLQTEGRLRNSRNVLSASGRHAEEQNVAWLKQKLIPYLKRLVQFQRGR